MTRCIHRTRCVRYIDQIGVGSKLSISGRGLDMRISVNVNDYISNELSFNIADLCPVGALTTMPYAFEARSWEIKSYTYTDILDSICSSTRSDFVGGKIARVLPLVNESINEE